MHRKLLLGLALAFAATAAIAIPPGPDEIGEFYFYFDEAGNEVGGASIDCQGHYSEWGVRTANYSAGHRICPPDR
ncbi:DUF6289 family protein [Vulcaniibacterium tengchongense]|uniref:Uncharacterized protein n=1 Tax=Vulcaniibacterium tengchongense TaxID=1273429 RepID=A0A3N4VTZ7_9GAMM|nr:DUF6289 family protein [Vulcaniibacterium tengchongense]RPE77290.1 hypothetical protein EDC50_2556 [Vulcaniibacterium tengchongense]